MPCFLNEMNENQDDDGVTKIGSTPRGVWCVFDKKETLEI